MTPFRTSIASLVEHFRRLCQRVEHFESEQQRDDAGEHRQEKDPEELVTGTSGFNLQLKHVLEVHTPQTCVNQYVYTQ